MPIPIYLAMTAPEILHAPKLPEKMGYMACHFSPYGTGLTNCPSHLPPESILILNDRTPVMGHDRHLVAKAMQDMARSFQCAGILLDLQQPGNPETEAIVRAICTGAPCPVAVTEYYAADMDCAVLLAPPLHIPLVDFLAPWKPRDIWLEAAPESLCFTVTDSGAACAPLPCPPENFPHTADGAYSRYHIDLTESAIRFSFRRCREDVEKMAAEAENVQYLVGLYQQLK